MATPFLLKSARMPSVHTHTHARRTHSSTLQSGAARDLRKAFVVTQANVHAHVVAGAVDSRHAALTKSVGARRLLRWWARCSVGVLLRTRWWAGAAYACSTCPLESSVIIAIASRADIVHVHTRHAYAPFALHLRIVDMSCICMHAAGHVDSTKKRHSNARGQYCMQLAALLTTALAAAASM